MDTAEIEQIQVLLRKKQYDPETAGWEEKQKIMAFLYRKGYSQENIRCAMQAMR
jgi:regulatory protein